MIIKKIGKALEKGPKSFVKAIHQSCCRYSTYGMSLFRLTPYHKNNSPYGCIPRKGCGKLKTSIFHGLASAMMWRIEGTMVSVSAQAARAKSDILKI